MAYLPFMLESTNNEKNYKKKKKKTVFIYIYKITHKQKASDVAPLIKKVKKQNQDSKGYQMNFFSLYIFNLNPMIFTSHNRFFNIYNRRGGIKVDWMKKTINT